MYSYAVCLRRELATPIFRFLQARLILLQLTHRVIGGMGRLKVNDEVSWMALLSTRMRLRLSWVDAAHGRRASSVDAPTLSCSRTLHLRLQFQTHDPFYEYQHDENILSQRQRPQI